MACSACQEALEVEGDVPKLCEVGEALYDRVVKARSPGERRERRDLLYMHIGV